MKISQKKHADPADLYTSLLSVPILLPDMLLPDMMQQRCNFTEDVAHQIFSNLCRPILTLVRNQAYQNVFQGVAHDFKK